MNNPTYAPRADSLASRLISFFQRNQDEVLLLDDITEKFDTTRGNIHTQLGAACDAGMLMRDRNDDGDYTYQAGPALPKPAPGEGVNIDAVHSKAAVPPASKTVLPTPADVQIDTDIPIQTGKGATKRDWTPLLQRLKPGHSCKLPLAARHTLSANVTAAKKNQLGIFTIRLFPDTQELRVWRVS